jgi:hypothetical protein
MLGALIWSVGMDGCRRSFASTDAMLGNEKKDSMSCWEFADGKIRELRAKIKLADDGDYDGNSAVMRDMLDKWLEYRHSHGPDDVRQGL